MDGHEPHCCVRLLRLPQQSSTAGVASRIEISSLVQESRNLRYQQDVLLPKGVMLHRAGPRLPCVLGGSLVCGKTPVFIRLSPTPTVPPLLLSLPFSPSKFPFYKIFSCAELFHFHYCSKISEVECFIKQAVSFTSYL